MQDTLNSGNPNLAKPAAQSDPDPDVDSEPRSASTANAPDAGCDRFLDTDGDGLPNWYEKQLLALSPGVTDILPTTPLWGTQVSALQYMTAGANPLRMDADSDGDGITDAREFALNLNPALADSNGNGTKDIDPDTLEDPSYDSDGDGLANGEDAVAWDNRLHFKRTPESRYAVLELGQGYPHFINDRNEVIIHDYQKPTAPPHAAPQGLRLWRALTGVSEPVMLDATKYWTSQSGEFSLPLSLRDFDDNGRRFQVSSGTEVA